MHPAVMVSLSLLVPLACLGLLLFLSWLEDTLDADVVRSERRHDPAPVLAIRVTPEPEAEPMPDPAPAPAPHIAGNGVATEPVAHTPAHEEAPPRSPAPAAGVRRHGEPAVTPVTP